MASKLTDTLTGVTTTGTKNPATLTKFPELGGTFQAALSGSGTSATVRLTAWNIGANPLTLATMTLSSGTPSEAVPVFATYDDWAWEVDAVSDSTGLTLTCVGVGV
jgi:hypothetical protein